MRFDLSGIDQTMADSAAEFLNQSGYATETGGICIEWKCDPLAERLRVEYKDGTLLLYGRERVHFYRGLTLFLSELIEYGDNCADFKKEEQISFRESGVMLDCSRNGAANIRFLKRMIRFCASCGLNQLYLYMEDMYEVPDYPYFGAWRGRFKHDELEEIDRYGQKFGLEVIPAIQTLAHMHTYLRWPAAQDLKDTDDILMVGSPKTYAFVEALIRNVSGCFSTKKIHVGMDEADFLGLGKYLRVHGYEDRYQIMTKHLKTVCSICKELSLEPMIWSDMFFRLKSPTGDYYDLSEETTFDEIFELPEGVELVYWDYYHHDQSDYEKNIRLHHKITDQLRFAAGGWTWNGISPNYSKAEKTIAEGIMACRKQGVDKAFCTFWFDNGAETPMQTAWYPIAYFAQQCYSECAEKAEMLRKMREEIWFYECRPFGFEVLDIRFGAISIRLRSAQKRMEAWSAGYIEHIEELEEPRLLYTEDKNNPGHRQCAAGFWENIVSAGNVSGI